MFWVQASRVNRLGVLGFRAAGFGAAAGFQPDPKSSTLNQVLEGLGFRLS